MSSYDGLSIFQPLVSEVYSFFSDTVYNKDLAHRFAHLSFAEA